MVLSRGGDEIQHLQMCLGSFRLDMSNVFVRRAVGRAGEVSISTVLSLGWGVALPEA